MNNPRFHRTTGPTAQNNSAFHSKQMGVIMEDEIPDRDTRGGASGLSRNYSNADNDNLANRSGNLLEDSIAEPGRVP
jgi:hypothetical protein